MIYVFVLHSLEDHGLYIGFSTNLKKRIAEHEHGASFATKYRGPWKLIYYEAYIDRERYLKSRSGRRFLRQQLRHYFEKFPARQVLRGPTGPARERRRRFHVATPHGFEP